MANKQVAEMGLPSSIANVFSARNIKTAKEVLSLTEFELMELLDVNLSEVCSAVAHISAIVSPPFITARVLMHQRLNNARMPTCLKGLDDALHGGIPFGVVTELVGPAGIGKTQLCLKLSLVAALPSQFGGLDGSAIYIDVESKFSSRRMIEIGASSFPEVFKSKELAREMAGRVLVLQPTSLSDFTESLQKVKEAVFQNRVRLLVVDSMTALVSGGNEDQKQPSLGWHISFIKSLAELGRIPVVVTNQVRTRNENEHCQYGFEAVRTGLDERAELQLVAAMGVHWSHAVTIRLVLELKSGGRLLKVAKSPISPPLCFPFVITAAGIKLLEDNGAEIDGQEITAISNSGIGNLIGFDGGCM